jgi:hypothetical protein
MNKKILIYLQVVFSLALTVIGVDASERYGCIKGKILNAENDDPLYGANIIIVDKKQGDISDKDGYFIVRDLPMGTYTVRAAFMGFAAVEKEVVLKSSETVIDFRLRETVMNADAIVVTATRTE